MIIVNYELLSILSHRLIKKFYKECKMEKKFLLTTIILVFMVALLPASVKAEGPTGDWVSGIACQNLDQINNASISLSFYQEGSATAAITYSDTILAGKSKNWLTSSGSTLPGFPDPFLGSATISSSTPLSCNLNTQINGLGTTVSPYRLGTSMGFDASRIAPKLYVPQVIKNIIGYSTYVSVQNTGTASTAVTVYYYGLDGVEVVAARETATIPGQSNRVFYQESNSNLPASWMGSCVIKADDNVTPIAAINNMYRDATEYTRTQMLSSNAVASGSAKLFVPRFVHDLIGYESGLAIQNIGTVATQVRITFTFDTEYIYETTVALEPNISLALKANDSKLGPVLSDVLLLAQGTPRQGSAVIEALAPGAEIIATVNEDKQTAFGNAWREGHGATYNAIPDGDQSDTVFFSQFVYLAAGIWTGGFQVSNTTSTPGTCDITYNSDLAPSANEVGVAIPGNGTIVRWGPTVVNLDSGYNGSVTVTCTVPVTGISNMAADNQYGDSFSQTNGLNQ